MKLRKKLRIEEFKICGMRNGRYELFLRDLECWELNSKFSLGKDELIFGNLNPSEKILGKDLAITFVSTKFKYNEREGNKLYIVDLEKTETAGWNYYSIPKSKSKKSRYILHLKTPIPGGSLVLVPLPFYDLKISLNEAEYQKVKRLSPSTVFEISYCLDLVGFEDVIVTYRCSLNSPRVFPLGYANKIIPLIQAAIDYFEGDIDCLSHLSGLEIELEGASSNRKRENHGSRSWRRDYFLIESYGQRWKGRFKKDLTEVDKILMARYDNKLPATPVREFYDRIEIFAYETKKKHFIEEISVGLLAKYTFQKDYHLPSIEIETRSISGNLKACESVGQRFIEKAKEIFRLKKEVIHIQTEEYIDEG